MADVTTEGQGDEQPLVERADLGKRLAAAAARPLTIVRAPMGYGKTEALVRFRERAPNPAWVTLTAQTGRSSFWRRMRVALEVVDPAIPWTRASSELVASGPNERFLDAFRAALSASTRPTTLVLDDLDRVRDAATTDEIARLVDMALPNLRLVVAGRHDMRLPIGRWRAQGRVHELGPDDLRFRPHDTEALLRRLGAEEVDPTVAQQLTDRAEGWPAGVQLLAAAREAQSPDPLDDERARALIARILGNHPAEVQAFLLTTSVLERFTADLCRFVTGHTDSGWFLREVERVGLFVVPLDDEGRWFRYNRLFAELLRSELDRRAPGVAADLRRKAAQWFAARSDAQEAVRHLTAAGDIGSAFELISEDPYHPWWGAIVGVDWTDLFPASWIAADPSRMLHFATLLGRSGRPDEAKEWLERARAAVEPLPDDDPLHGLLMAADVLWSGVVCHARRTIDLGKQVLQRPPPAGGTDDFHPRVRVAMTGAHFLLDEVDAAERMAAELDASTSSEVVRSLVVAGWRARVAYRRGQLHRAEDLALRAMRTAKSMGIPTHPGIREAQFALGGVLAERGETRAAERLVAAAADVVSRIGWPAIAASYRSELAAMKGIRDPEAGLALLREIRRGLADVPVGTELLATLDAHEARLRLRNGEVGIAEALVPRLLPGIDADLVEVRIALARGETHLAGDLLHSLWPRNRRDQLLCDLLAARVAERNGDWLQRDLRLVAAARTGAAEGFGRVFLDEAPELLPVLEDLTHREPHVRTLLERIAASAGSYGVPPAPQLSPREEAVLRYLAGSLTHQEIAHELGVSTNTVKSHVRALYRKLDVRSRPDAVAVARRMTIL